MEVWDVGACVVRLWSHVVALVFRELLCLGGFMPRVAFTLCLTLLVLWESCWARLWLWVVAFSSFASALLEFLLLWLVSSFPAGSECELQESVAAVAGCACYERDCYFARAEVGFVLSLRIHVGVSRRLREPACGVAFTGAGLLPMDPVEGRVLVGCPLVVGSTSLLKLSRCFVCCVAPLVERCDTCLWLLSALC
ncbi:hypothetical protein Taro_049009 [Colocasia esculenta]|uniref:Uncharacterized protein n=1 Tax=Colocasia esculenta TaxID=4460 RepID=A0A843X9P4_COLES|nr:hypothetical protein [Colocasia esculenta]